MEGLLIIFECQKFQIRIHLGPFALYWLHRQTADFKAKYIRSMINIAASWDGAIKALRLMISGDNIDVRLNNFILFILSLFLRSMLFFLFVFVLINVPLHRMHLLC